MRRLTANEARYAGSVPPTRYYSLGLPSWAATTARGSDSASRSAPKRSLTRQTLRHLKSHPTHIG
jgi:hypothetical protein